MPVYQYRIPLSETERGLEPVYEYPEENEISKCRDNGYLIVTLSKTVPHFHKDSIAVQEDVLVAEEHESGDDKS